MWMVCMNAWDFLKFEGASFFVVVACDCEEFVEKVFSSPPFKDIVLRWCPAAPTVAEVLLCIKEEKERKGMFATNICMYAPTSARRKKNELAWMCTDALDKIRYCGGDGGRGKMKKVMPRLGSLDRWDFPSTKRRLPSRFFSSSVTYLSSLR